MYNAYDCATKAYSSYTGIKSSQIALTFTCVFKNNYMKTLSHELLVCLMLNWFWAWNNISSFNTKTKNKKQNKTKQTNKAESLIIIYTIVIKKMHFPV